MLTYAAPRPELMNAGEEIFSFVGSNTSSPYSELMYGQTWEGASLFAIDKHVVATVYINGKLLATGSQMMLGRTVAKQIVLAVATGSGTTVHGRIKPYAYYITLDY